MRSGHNVKVGYLSQHAETAAGTGTVLDAAQRETGLSGQKARDLLGGFLFSGADVEKALDDISGGEQRRLSLAILVASGANVLILDEPTNHLDIESREALEDALSVFEGAVILVSHDRALLEAVGSRTLVCERRKRSHPSGWAAYQRRGEEDEEAVSAAAAAAKRSASGKRRAHARSPSGPPARQAAGREDRGVQAVLRAVEEEQRHPPPGRRRPSSGERAPRRSQAQGRRVYGEQRQEDCNGRSAQRAIQPDPGAQPVMLRTLTSPASGPGR